MTLVIYLGLIAVGFYFGKWLGALGLIAIYFFFFHSRQLARQQSQKNAKIPQKSNDLTWAYRELGVAKNADSETIKQARKRLLNHYHPDKLGQAEKEEKHAAEQKVNDINRAYQAIKQDKNFN